MKVAILTAGKGKRLGMSIPKSLVVLNSKRIIDYQLKELEKAGIDKKNVSLITGYKSELFENISLKKFNNPLYESTNQIYSIFCAQKLRKEKEVTIIYGDVLFRDSLFDDFENINENIVVPSYTGYRRLWQLRGDEKFVDLESFYKDSANQIKEIGGKVLDINSVNGQFMGILIFKNYSFNYFIEEIKKYKNEFGEEALFSAQTTEFLNHLIQNSLEIFSFDYSDFFMEIDNKIDLELSKKLMLK